MTVKADELKTKLSAESAGKLQNRYADFDTFFPLNCHIDI